MSAIQSVQFKAGGMLINGFIQFAVLGGKEAWGAFGMLRKTKIPLH